MSAAEEAGAAWAIAWEIDKAAARAGKKAYKTAQNVAMWANSKRFGGDSDSTAAPPATTTDKPVKKGSGKQWSTVEDYRNTTVVSTTEWSKKTR
jgi:hypothetical protein